MTVVWADTSADPETVIQELEGPSPRRGCVCEFRQAGNLWDDLDAWGDERLEWLLDDLLAFRPTPWERVWWWIAGLWRGVRR